MVLVLQELCTLVLATCEGTMWISCLMLGTSNGMNHGMGTSLQVFFLSNGKRKINKCAVLIQYPSNIWYKVLVFQAELETVGHSHTWP